MPAETAGEDRRVDINMKLLPVPLAPWGYLTRKITQSYGGNQVFSKPLRARRSAAGAARKFMGRDDVIKFASWNLNLNISAASA